MMRMMPLCSLLFVFWQLGNRQIFDNFVVPVTNQHEHHFCGHNFWQSIQQLNWYSPNFLPILILVLMILQQLFSYVDIIKTQDLVLEDEGLNPYFTSLKKQEVDRLK
jgi:hypothetical protein